MIEVFRLPAVTKVWGQIGHPDLTEQIIKAKSASLFVYLRSRRNWEKKYWEQAIKQSNLPLEDIVLWGQVLHRFLQKDKTGAMPAVLLSGLAAAITGERELPNYANRYEAATGFIVDLVSRYDSNIAAIVVGQMGLFEQVDLIATMMTHKQEKALAILENDFLDPKQGDIILVQLAYRDSYRPLAKIILEKMKPEKAGKILSAMGPAACLVWVINDLDNAVWEKIKTHIDPAMLSSWLYRETKIIS